MSVSMSRWHQPHESMEYYGPQYPVSAHVHQQQHLQQHQQQQQQHDMWANNAAYAAQQQLVAAQQQLAAQQAAQQLAAHHAYLASHFSPPSTTRAQRNQAEKMRRDKLNFFINELSTLVPIIRFAQKKLDKTSILRLAATYIRLHNVVFGSGKQLDSSVHNQMLEYLPHALASYNWSENVLEEMDGMLMIVNGAGSIIFISHTVERLLGHTQIELMGQSLYNLTCLEDYDELKRNLAPDEEWNSTANSASNRDMDESSSDSSCPPPTPPVRPALMPPDSQEKQRRSFFVRLKQRAQSRGDTPQYVLVHIVGHLRVPPRTSPQASTSRSASPPVNHNNITLVAVVKPFQEKRITTLSLMEASREEFITRHTIDGRILYTDHRISIVAGYLSEEVCGIPGFQYMHKEDMRWTMVGLRQMFYRGSSFGQSCYRLQTKTGNFIYLKTCGYLELSENNESFQSLICINSLVSAEEGEALIQKMKDQFSPVIRSKSDKNMEILTSPIQSQAALKNAVKMEERMKGETENSDALKEAITHMISNVPTPPPFLNMQSPSSSSSDPNDTKIALIKKQMPPVEEQIKRVGINQVLKMPIRVGTSLSSPSSMHSQHSQHSPPMRGSPPSVRPFTPPPTVQQNRPSVLRCATKTTQGDQVSVIKIKRQRTDETGQDIVTVSPCTVVVSPGSSSSSVCGKRKSVDSGEWPMPPLRVDVPLPPPQFRLDDLLNVPEVDGNDILSSFPLPDDASSPSLAENLDDIGHLEDMYSLGWPLGQLDIPEEVLERSDALERPSMLESSHRSLDSNLQLQDNQIHKIQQDLEMVAPEHTNGSHQVYNTKLSQLQVEHRKQQQLLRSLQQDHQQIQQLSSQQNVV